MGSVAPFHCHAAVLQEAATVEFEPATVEFEPQLLCILHPNAAYLRPLAPILRCTAPPTAADCFPTAPTDCHEPEGLLYIYRCGYQALSGAHPRRRNLPTRRQPDWQHEC